MDIHGNFHPILSKPVSNAAGGSPMNQIPGQTPSQVPAKPPAQALPQPPATPVQQILQAQVHSPASPQGAVPFLPEKASQVVSFYAPNIGDKTQTQPERAQMGAAGTLYHVLLQLVRARALTTVNPIISHGAVYQAIKQYRAQAEQDETEKDWLDEREGRQSEEDSLFNLFFGGLPPRTRLKK